MRCARSRVVRDIFGSRRNETKAVVCASPCEMPASDSNLGMPSDSLSRSTPPREVVWESACRSVAPSSKAITAVCGRFRTRGQERHLRSRFRAVPKVPQTVGRLATVERPFRPLWSTRNIGKGLSSIHESPAPRHANRGELRSTLTHGADRAACLFRQAARVQRR
jgi:hypothetical protein